MIDLNMIIKVDGVSYEDRKRAIDEAHRKVKRVVNIGIVVSLIAFFGGLAMVIFGG
jgi:hypothetical protein